MTHKQVRTALYFGSKSHLRSKAAKREILLWAGEVGRVTRSGLFEPFWRVLRSQTTLEGPLHPFLVFGLKTPHNFTPWSFPLLTPKRPLYFRVYHNHAISGMDSRQATTTSECFVPHLTPTAPFSPQTHTINTLFRSAKHIFCAEIYTYTPGADPPETAGSLLTNHITPTLDSNLTPIKKLLELFRTEICRLKPLFLSRDDTHHGQALTTSCAHFVLPSQELTQTLARDTRPSHPPPSNILPLGPPPQDEGPCDHINKIKS